MPQIRKSLYKGGPGVIDYLMRRNCARALTEAEAIALWEECRPRLPQDTVDQCEESRGGSLDTLERGDMLDALAMVFVNMPWPIHATPEPESKNFVNALLAELAKRAYRVDEEQL